MPESKSKVYGEIVDLAKAIQLREPSLTLDTAIIKTLDTEAGRELRIRYSEAIEDAPTPPPQGAAPAFAGGANAELLAERIEELVSEIVARGISTNEAYSRVLSSKEGQSLRKRYETFVRG